MKTRRMMGAVAIVALTLFAGACGNNKDDDASPAKKDRPEESTSTTSKSDDSSTSSAVDQQTSTTESATVTDDEYAAQIKKIDDAIKAAGTDACKLAEATTEAPPDPTTKAQTKAVVNTYALLLDAVAGAIKSGDSAVALSAAATNLKDAASKADYPTAYLSSDEFTKLMTSEAVTAGLNEFQAAASKCSPSGN